MAAYAAAVSLKALYSSILHYYDDALSPQQRSTFECADKELKRLQDFVERLDRQSRQRMSAWLERIPEALRESIQTPDNAIDIDEIFETALTVLERLKKMQEDLLQYEEAPISSSSSSSNMIGLRDERNKLKEGLVISELGEKTIFLIHGMAGIGKTMLALEVYEDLDISELFECRAWVTAGIGRKPKDLTEAILAQVDPEMVMGGDEEEIAQQLKERLEHKRCLIVVDDVWNYDIFLEYLNKLMSHSSKDSRVMLTSRLHFPGEGHLPCAKRLLNKEESWDLLCEKVFAGGPCPPQLEDSGKKIAEKCDGLPLTIITVADLLSKAEESLWVEVAEKRKHQIFSDAYDQISKVLYPSYKELRDGFKLCFLYMGVFPLKYEMHRSKLINLWSAEKIFDQFEEGKSPYVTFLNLIEYLDHCSLVMVCQRNASYSLMKNYSPFERTSYPFRTIRTCRLHSSWWYFCQREARKTNFFHVLHCPEDAFEESIKGQSRLSIHNNVLFALKDVYNSIEEHCASTAESLLCFGPYHQYMVPLCFGLKFLQRLDALNIRFYDFPLEVLQLAKLLYLALTCNKQLPCSISKLEKLQYLIVHPHLSIKSCGAPIYMPMEIWDLQELKHLEVLGSDLPDPGDKSLEMLSTLLDVGTASCSVLDKLPNLEKLRIRIVLTPEAPDPLCCFAHIPHLMNITSMTCVVANPVFKFPVVLPVALFPVLPNELVKLSLSGLGYPWEKMKDIASLVSLRVLELQCNAFHGQVWEVEERKFRYLKVLVIEDLDLVKLEAGHGSFEELHHLSIKHCYKLEEIKLRNIRDISMVEVVDSNPLAVKSIKQTMLEEQNIPDHFSVHYSWKSA